LRDCNPKLRNAAQMHSLANARLNCVESMLKKALFLLALLDCLSYAKSKAKYFCFHLHFFVGQDH